MLHNVLSLGLLTSRFPDHIKVGTFVFMYSIFFLIIICQLIKAIAFDTAHLDVHGLLLFTFKTIL